MRAMLWAALLCLSIANLARAASDEPQRVTFSGPDGVQLVGYLFRPAAAAKSPTPAIVLLHGRAGPYSTLADGVYDATTLSKRHMFWGRFWAEHGFAALLVDSFGPRGFPAGFPVHSYDERPSAVSEVTVRPRDAMAGLAYLRGLPGVDGRRVVLQGWSNGGSTALVTMADATLAGQQMKPQQGFLGAVVFYPACGLKGAFDSGYRPYAPVRVFSGADDEEVSAEHCARFVAASKDAGGNIDQTIYPGATHDFDDPGRKRQSVEANAMARDDAIHRVETFVSHLVGR